MQLLKGLKMIKYFCDCCDKQVIDEWELFTCRIPRRDGSDTPLTKTWSICEDCLNKLNSLLCNGKKEIYNG